MGLSPEEALKDIKRRYVGATSPGAQFLGITKYPLTPMYGSVKKARWLFRTDSSGEKIIGAWERPPSTPSYWFDKFRDTANSLADFKEQLRTVKEELDEVYDQLREEEEENRTLRKRIHEARSTLFPLSS